MVSLWHFAAGFLLTAGIGRRSATRYKQSRSSVTVYSARPTKSGLALYRVTVVRKSWVRQQGLTISWRQQTRIELYALVNPKPKYLIIKKTAFEVYCRLLKLTTDRHEASRGLAATAGYFFDLQSAHAHWYTFLLPTLSDCGSDSNAVHTSFAAVFTPQSPSPRYEPMGAQNPRLLTACDRWRQRRHKHSHVATSSTGSINPASKPVGPLASGLSHSLFLCH